MADRNLLYDFGDEGEGEAPSFQERWGSLPVEAPRFNLTPNVALVESTPKPLKQGTDPVTGRPDLKFVPVDDPWANTPKPIKRLLGVGGEERYQTWPERALRSGLSAPLDAMQGKLPTIDPETGDVPRTTMEPNAFGRLLGMKGGWQGVSSEGAIGRAQDVASVGGPGAFVGTGAEKGFTLGVVPVDVAKRLNISRGKHPDVLKEAVENTPGAKIDQDGDLVVNVSRSQHPLQEGEESVRGGVFYLPSGKKGYSYTGKNGYGGSQSIEGETAYLNPLVVKGTTGGKVPKMAFDQLNGKGSYESMRSDALKATGSYGKEASKTLTKQFLDKYAPEISDKAEYIIQNSKGGNRLPYALQEAAVGSAARKAGHDGVIGYSVGRGDNKKPFLSEVYDVRESHYPDTEGGYNIHPQFMSDSSKPGMAMAAINSQRAAPFYSAVEHAVSNIKQDKMPADQWLGTLTNSKGVKPEELDWTGLKDHLAEKGKEPVTKQEVQDYVNANKVELKEVNKGAEGRDENGNLGTGGDTKYSSYQLPGGENYKEMLMTLPIDKLKHAKELLGDKWGMMTPEQQEKFLSYGIKGGNDTNVYKSSHWDEPNVLAHVRTNDRNITAPGETTPKKSLHIEEIQSDWHQAGRDKGYTQEKEKRMADLIKQRDELKVERDKYAPTGDTRKKWIEIDDKMSPIQEKINAIGKEDYGVPDAPFKKTWHELALKRMIREAAEKGYDRLSWTPGEAQAARYDLSKHVDKISYHPETGQLRGWKNGEVNIRQVVEPKDLPNAVGKEAAEKLLKTERKPDPAFRGALAHDVHSLSGVDLKVGGEGMKGFYDKMIPNAIEKIGKEHGVKVKQTELNNEMSSNMLKAQQEIDKNKYKFDNWEEIRNKFSYLNREESNKLFKNQKGEFGNKVHYIDIPESLKNQALGKGFPLFSTGGHFLNPIPGNPHEQVDNSHHVPYGAGASNTPTGFPVNIDKRIPKYDDKLKLPNGQPADLHKYLTIHEIEEYKAMKAGIPYHKAHHEIATPMEKKAVESDGVSWKEYTHIMDGYLKETEEAGYKNLPPRLYTKPYPHSRSLKMDHGEDNGKDN